VEAYVAGTKVRFFIDSGAQVNTITSETFNAIQQNEIAKQNLYETDKILRAYASQSNIQVIATFAAQLFVSHDRPVLIEKFYVIKENRATSGIQYCY
jgi:hypothetical protein